MNRVDSSMVTSANEIAGYRIVKNFGIVRGIMTLCSVLPAARNHRFRLVSALSAEAYSTRAAKRLSSETNLTLLHKRRLRPRDP